MIELRPHQKRVVQSFLKSPKGLLVIHGLGSGKTFTGIACAEAFPDPNIEVVVATPAKLRENFKNAIKLFGARKKYSVISHTALGSHDKDDLLDQKLVIIDEVHNLRNANLAAKALLRGGYVKVVLLTATPMVNSQEDLIIPLQAVGVKYSDRIGTLERNAHNRVSVYLKSSPADFPRRKDVTLRVPFSADQYQEYCYIVERNPGIRLALPNDANDVPVPTDKDMAFLGKVRQVSNVVSWWKKDPKKYVPETPKLKKLMELLYNGAGPALVYSNYIGMGKEPIEWALTHPGAFGFERRLRFTAIDGGSTDAHVRDSVSKYNEGKFDVLLITGAGGEGLDLKKTRQVHIMEQFWHDTRISQVAGRAIRYKSHEGLKEADREVTVYSYVGIYPSASVISSVLASIFRFLGVGVTLPKLTADEYLLDLTVRKAVMVGKYLDALQAASIECSEDPRDCPKRAVLKTVREQFSLGSLRIGDFSDRPPKVPVGAPRALTATNARIKKKR